MVSSSRSTFLLVFLVGSVAACVPRSRPQFVVMPRDRPQYDHCPVENALRLACVAPVGVTVRVDPVGGAENPSPPSIEGTVEHISAETLVVRTPDSTLVRMHTARIARLSRARARSTEGRVWAGVGPGFLVGAVAGVVWIAGISKDGNVGAVIVAPMVVMMTGLMGGIAGGVIGAAIPAMDWHVAWLRDDDPPIDRFRRRGAPAPR